MRIFWAFIIIFGVIFGGCSNLSSPRFSKGFYEERVLQLTRKAALQEGEKTALVGFSVYLSDLDSKTYPNNEVFLIEVSFEDEQIVPDDLSFTLLGKSPIEFKKLSNQEVENFKIYRHSPWSEFFFVRFNAVLSIDITNVLLKMHIKGKKQTLDFDYSYVVETIL